MQVRDWTGLDGGTKGGVHAFNLASPLRHYSLASTVRHARQYNDRLSSSSSCPRHPARVPPSVRTDVLVSSGDHRRATTRNLNPPAVDEVLATNSSEARPRPYQPFCIAFDSTKCYRLTATSTALLLHAFLAWTTCGRDSVLTSNCNN